VSNIDEDIQGFFLKIIEFQAHTIPSTPPEEREKRENMVNMIIENINSLK
jgi:hypothetical protein